MVTEASMLLILLRESEILVPEKKLESPDEGVVLVLIKTQSTDVIFLLFTDCSSGLPLLSYSLGTAIRLILSIFRSGKSHLTMPYHTSSIFLVLSSCLLNWLVLYLQETSYKESLSFFHNLLAFLATCIFFRN